VRDHGTSDELDFDALYEEAARADGEGECSLCEEWHSLCGGSVCFQYCHDRYFHEIYDDPSDEAHLESVE